MARRPLAVLLVALLVAGAATAGFVRFSVDAGQSLLVGSQSTAGKATQQFDAAFGTDPIVVVLTARNPSAPYIEKNLERLAALEDDLAHDPSVAAVLGPGTVARSALAATTAEIARTLGTSPYNTPQTVGEYPYFVAETHYLLARQQGTTDATALATQFEKDLSDARGLLQLYVGRAARDAHLARQAYEQKTPPTTDRILDGQELAADAAAAQDPLPPLFANYVSGPSAAADTAAAKVVFDRLTASYGDCSDQIAQLLGISPTCQIYLARFLLDLPSCPTESAFKAAGAKGEVIFCTPKQQWAAVLPSPSITSDGSMVAREIITVRLTPAAAANRSAVLAVQKKINDELSGGIVADDYTRTFPSSQFKTVHDLGPLAPSDCGDVGQSANQSCYSRFNNTQFTWTIAGAPLLTYGVVDSMTQTLLILLPVVIVLMAILLVATFRLRGRLWPLLAAVAATGTTVGLSLWSGLAITPAVLAGIPVLIGLGVDYAVQLVARYDEARGRGASIEDALGESLGQSGPATLTAALATLAGLASLMIVSGVDAGPLVAVPLVAEFALVLCVGVLLAWLAAVFVALPAAALGDRRSRLAVDATPVVRWPERTLAIATSWRGALVPAVIAALVGWVLLPTVPVQTDVEQLLAPSLPQVQAINTVRNETGYSNEVDIFLQGRVAGPYNQAGVPDNVTWQCLKSTEIRSLHPDQVAMATSIADFFIASASSAAATTSPPCTAASTTGGGSTTPSPGASPTASATAASSAPGSASPAATGSPTAVRDLPGRVILAASAPGSPTAAAGSTASPAASASPGSSASASAGPAPTTQQAVTQSAFVCDLRLLPGLSRNLLQPIPSNTQPCPALDKYLDAWLSPDQGTLDPNAARIVVGVQGNSIADQARLIDSISNELGTPPNGMTATPAGIAAVAAQAYDNIVSRGLLLNLVPLALVFLALLALERNLRRAALPVLPTAIAAGWAPLILKILSFLPGGLGQTLGAFNPLTVVLGALVIALATEFGVVLLRRFDEEIARGLAPDDAAAAALAVTGRAIRVSALTLGAGFAVLALSALLPHGLPLLGSFGFTVVIDLGLAVAAVFGIMLPVAVAIERQRYRPSPVAVTARPVATPAPETTRAQPKPRTARGTARTSRAAPAAADAPTRGAGGASRKRPATPRTATPTSPAEPAQPADAAVPQPRTSPRLVDITPVEGPAVPPASAPLSTPGPGTPGPARRRPVSGRRRPAGGDDSAPPPAEKPTSRRAGVSGRRRPPRPGGGTTPP